MHLHWVFFCNSAHIKIYSHIKTIMYIQYTFDLPDIAAWQNESLRTVVCVQGGPVGSFMECLHGISSCLPKKLRRSSEAWPPDATWWTWSVVGWLPPISCKYFVATMSVSDVRRASQKQSMDESGTSPSGRMVESGSGICGIGLNATLSTW